MKVYNFTCRQLLPITLDEAWDFFSSPKNLKEITPDYLDFKITSSLDDAPMYEGQMITYIVKPLLGIPMRWATEITHVRDKEYFIDEQRVGPYALWHHEHWFEETADGVLMLDNLYYSLPLGLIGRIANRLIVKNKIQEIFSYRKNKLASLWPENELHKLRTHLSL